MQVRFVDGIVINEDETANAEMSKGLNCVGSRSAEPDHGETKASQCLMADPANERNLPFEDLRVSVVIEVDEGTKMFTDGTDAVDR